MTFASTLLAALLLATAATASSNGTILDLCTGPALCLRDGNATTTTLLNATAQLNLSNRNISAVAKVPSQLDSLDLSHNKLQGFPTAAASVNVRALNLSFNPLNLSSLVLPQSVSDLDLSHTLNDAANASFSLAFFQSLGQRAPKLARLSYRGNNLGAASITSQMFSSTLVYMDLSENPELVLTLDQDTYTSFSRPDFTLHVTNQSATSVICAANASIQRLPATGVLVCVVTRVNGAGQDNRQNTMSLVIIGAGVFFTLVIVLRNKLTCLWRSKQMEHRPTFGCEDDYMDTKSPTSAV
ncbi:Aste57867_19767 [Aphanomyces stellatus]|uniref:Aste57867_19767 protein n=1 Tax=Aphanomyces stellatus TaxID=120398 RepID=A0A485LF70_9STRA|nr:hypothetical protein As57867_019702 [Aphanomyces stellatus]VFT96465.1 Aste57867_19767 [Aphanomyces stellatus]